MYTLMESYCACCGTHPQLSHVYNNTLDEPITLQLGKVGKCSTVKFSTKTTVEIVAISLAEYLDVAHFEKYDMILGMPFMHRNRVRLDFASDEVIVDGKHMKAEQVVLEDMNGRLHCHKITKKWCEGNCPKDCRRAIVEVEEEELAQVACC